MSSETRRRRPPKADDAPDLRAEMEAAKLLIQQLRGFHEVGDEDDEEVISDMVEGETNLFEAIGATLEKISHDMTHIEALKIHEERLKTRRERLKARNERRKWAIENALTLAKKSQLSHPLCNLNQTKSPPKVEVVHEADLPGHYWERGAPTLDKRKLLADLKAAKNDGFEIPGARLAGGDPLIRWKWS